MAKFKVLFKVDGISNTTSFKLIKDFGLELTGIKEENNNSNVKIMSMNGEIILIVIIRGMIFNKEITADQVITVMELFA